MAAAEQGCARGGRQTGRGTRPWGTTRPSPTTTAGLLPVLGERRRDRRL